MPHAVYQARPIAGVHRAAGERGARARAAVALWVNAGDCAVLFEEAADAGKRLDMFIEIDTAVGGADPTLGRNGGGFNHYQSSAAHGTGAQMNEMPIVWEAVVR